MKTLSVLFVLICCLITATAKEVVPRLHDEFDSEKWPQVEVTLSQAGTLKNLFDAGLRPYRFPALENTTLEVKHLNLTLVLDSGKILPTLPLEWIHIKVFTDGELATIVAATPKLTLEHARQQMVMWLPFGENNRSLIDLDEFLEAVKNDYLDFDDPYRGISHGCGIGWNEPGFKTPGGGPKIGVGFRKTANQEQPLRLYFAASWGLNRTSKERGIYSPDPIMPPHGYEDVDMTAPQNFGPDSQVDILRSKNVDIGDGEGGVSESNDDQINRISSRHQSITDEPITQKKILRPSFIIFGIIIATLLLLVSFWRSEYRKPPN